MSRAFQELRGLVTEAVDVLGERRVALGAGCSVSSIQAWSRRHSACLMPSTVENTLPRLRRWREWVAGYHTERVEIQALLADPGDLADRFTELQQALEELSRSVSVERVALGCEVPTMLILQWRLGLVHFEDEGEAVLRALGHLRHRCTWPLERVASVHAGERRVSAS